MNKPVWIRIDAVLAIHQRQLAEHGGEDGVRDAGLLASALERPRNRWIYSDPRPDMPALAAAYAYGVSQNHPFVDGNKRTAWVTCGAFLVCNGLDLTVSQDEIVRISLQVAECNLTEAELAEWLRRHLRPIAE